jgi:hypothetical protein
VSIRSRLNTPATLHGWAEGGRNPDSGDYDEPGFDESRDRPVLVDLRAHGSTEDREGGSVSVVDAETIFLSPEIPDIGANDQVTVTGHGRYSFEGTPRLVTNPRTTARLHWLGTVRKVT